MNYIEKIVELIIRPSRDHYHTKRLGDPQILIETPDNHLVKALRQDRIILNKHNQHLHLSFYQILSVQKAQPYLNTDRNHFFSDAFLSPQFNNYNSQKFVSNFYSESQSNKTHQNKVENFKNKCVIYLHANNGSRMEGMTYLMKLLEARCNVCLFDCSGSGVSQGDYVTLGLKQARDLDSVVNFLVKEKKIQHIGLWGRSMGSATALIYGSRHAQQKLSCIVFDSPFKDLEKLIKQIASDKTGLPKMFFQPLLPFIRNQIQRKTGYNIGELKLKRYLQTSQDKKQTSQTSIGTSQKQFAVKQIRPLQKVPAIFVISKRDKFVKCHHGEKLFKRYPCIDKQLHYIDIEHHEPRQEYTIDKIINFIVVNFDKRDQSQPFLQKKNPFQDHQKRYSAQNQTLNNNINFMKYNWNQQPKETEYQVNLGQNHWYSPEKTTRTNLNYERKSAPVNFNPYQNYLSSKAPQNCSNQQFSPKISQVNSFISSSPQQHKELPQHLNQNLASSFYNTSQIFSKPSVNPQYISSYQPNRFPKLNSQYFQFSNQQTPYQSFKTQQSYSIYPKKHKQNNQRILSHQNSHQSLTTKGKNSEGFKYLNGNFKHFSLDKNNERQSKLGQDVKLNDSKYIDSDLGHKLVSKNYNKTNKPKQKISLSSTLAFQQNLKNSIVQENLMNSKFQYSINPTYQSKADPYQSTQQKIANTQNYVSQYPKNSYFQGLSSLQPPNKIPQSSILSKFKVPPVHTEFQNSPQLSKLNWNTSSQTNIKLDHDKSLFTKQQKTGPTYFTSASLQKQDPVYLSLIDTRSKGDAQKLKENNDLKSLSNRKVESTFTSMIVQDPKQMKQQLNSLRNHQMNLNESFVYSLERFKEGGSVHTSFGKF